MNRPTLRLALASTAITLIPAAEVFAVEEVSLLAGSTVQNSFIGDGLFSTGTLNGDERFFAQDLGPLGRSSARASEVADAATPAGLRYWTGALTTSAFAPPAADTTNRVETNFAEGIAQAQGLAGTYTYVIQILDLSIAGDGTPDNGAAAVLALSSGSADFRRGLTTSGTVTPVGDFVGTFSATTSTGWTLSAESAATSSDSSPLNNSASVDAQITIFEMGSGGVGCPTTGDPNEDCVIDATDLDIVGSLTRAIDMGNLSQSDLSPALEEDLDVGKIELIFNPKTMQDELTPVAMPDGVVNGDDMVVLVEAVLGTAFGDANLDQKVDTADLAILAGTGIGNPGGWAMGDFDSDGIVGTADLAILAGNFGFPAHPLQAAQTPAIPEPATLSLAAAALAAGLTGSRRRRTSA